MKICILFASSEKFLVPGKASIIVCAGRGDKLVALVLERIEVFHPHVASIRRSDIRLGGLVGPRTRVRMGQKRSTSILTHSYP